MNWISIIIFIKLIQGRPKWMNAFFSFLENINLPTFTDKQVLKLEGIISEAELLKALNSMKNYKSLGNDGIKKEFYESF